MPEELLTITSGLISSAENTHRIKFILTSSSSYYLQNFFSEFLAFKLSSYINIDVRTLAYFQKIGELQQLLRLLASRLGNKLDNRRACVARGSRRRSLSDAGLYGLRVGRVDLLAGAGDPHVKLPSNWYNAPSARSR